MTTQTTKTTYSGLARCIMGLFSILLIFFLLIEANYQLSVGKFKTIPILITDFLSFVFVYATITGNAPFGLFEPKNKNKE